MPARFCGATSHVRHQSHRGSTGSSPPLDAGRLSVCLQAVKRDVLQDMDVNPPGGAAGAAVGVLLGF